MPTTHYTTTEFLKKNGLYIGWLKHVANVNDTSSSKSTDSSCRDQKKFVNEIPGRVGKQTPQNVQKNVGISSSKKVYTTIIPAPQKPAVPPSLKRKSNNIIWVRLGKTDHPAYKLMLNNSSSTNQSNNIISDTLWVEWASNGKKDFIWRDQIVQGGLRDRKRQRPNYFS